MRLLLFLLLMIPAIATAQYKKFSIGAYYGTKEFKENLNSAALSLQYNTRNIFSFRTGILIDNSKKTVTDHVKSHPVDHYVYHDHKNEINNYHYSIPLLAQASIGNKIYITVFGGGIYSGLLSRPYVKTTTYFTDWQNNIYDEQVGYREGKVASGYKNELNIFYGFGFCWPLKSGLTFNTDLSVMNRWKALGNDRYYVVAGPRIQLGISYQLNLNKDSNYSFSTYSLKIKNSTGEK